MQDVYQALYVLLENDVKMTSKRRVNFQKIFNDFPTVDICDFDL